MPSETFLGVTEEDEIHIAPATLEIYYTFCLQISYKLYHVN